MCQFPPSEHYDKVINLLIKCVRKNDKFSTEKNRLRGESEKGVSASLFIYTYTFFVLTDLDTVAQYKKILGNLTIFSKKNVSIFRFKFTII